MSETREVAMGTAEKVAERRRKRRERKLEEKLWEAAYDLCEMGYERSEVERLATGAHRTFHKNKAEFGDEVPIHHRVY